MCKEVVVHTNNLEDYKQTNRTKTQHASPASKASNTTRIQGPGAVLGPATAVLPRLFVTGLQPMSPGPENCTPGSLVDPSKPYKFIVIGDIHDPKPCKFKGLGDVQGPQPYKFIGFGDIRSSS